MKSVCFILLFTLWTLSANCYERSDTDDCNCSSEYTAKIEDGELHCVGMNNGKILPCILAPYCKCQEDAIKVQWGRNGQFCAMGFNERMRVWPCENRHDWKLFRDKLKEKV